MKSINRRDFIRLTGTTAATGIAMGFPHIALGATRKVVVVGGGVGGCTAAKYLRKMDPNVDVTLITAEPSYISCFMSNEVLSGDRGLDSITFKYDGLKKYGINVLIDRVIDIDPISKVTTTAGGHTFRFDACIVSPGVDFKWETIDGYDAKTANKIPHAWHAGEQTTLLRKQLEAMPDGGKVVIVAPPNPFKCPPGPYERASQIAMYFKQHKPKSKIVIVDPKFKFSKRNLFFQGWTQLYGYDTPKSMIEWRPEEVVEAVDVKSNTLHLAGKKIKGDVVNIIPAQKAGKIAFVADLVDGDWCPVDKKTFESTKHKGIYVLGDASNASKMPKSAYAANSQAKVAVAAIVSRFNGLETPETTYVNTCYSIVGKEFGISVAAVYELDAEKNMIKSIKGSGGVSPIDASADTRKREVGYAHSWFRNVIGDMLG